jgi:hypothetical protein
MFTPPPTNKLTCLVNLSELKTQLGTAINTFVCPDGGLVTLADADEINFYTYDKSWYPNGSVLGIKKGNKNYIARLLKSGSGLSFTGFVDYDSWKANGYPPNTSFHATAPTLNQDLQVWAIEQSEDQQVRNIGLGTYSTPYYKQGEINTEGRNRLNYVLDQTASSCNFINNAKDATPKDGYSSQAGLEDLKTKLNKYTGLGDVVFKITDKNGNISHVTKDKIYKPKEAFLVPTNATVFEITEDADGKVDVNGKFKADPTCATCAGEAQKALTAALANMKAKHGGKIDPKKNVIEGSDFGINAGLAYQNMSLGEALTALAKGYNSLVENAKVPVEVWEPTKAFPVKDNWGIVSGAIDGAAAELTDKAQLVGMVLTVVANPKQTMTDIANFAEGAVTNWEQTKSALKAVGGGLVGYTKDLESSDPVYQGHGTGYMGGTLATQAVMGGVAVIGLLKGVKNAPGILKGRLDNIASALQRVKIALKTRFNWSDAEIDEFGNAIATKADADAVAGGCNAECAVGKYGCFTAKTPIQTDTSFMEAQDIKEGMLVQSYNHLQEKKELKEVLHVARHWVKTLLILTLSNGELIQTTVNHPFYVRKDYRKAETLVIGDTLFSKAGQVIRVSSKALKDTLIEVFNFTIAHNSNYFVGQIGILVHNDNCFLDNIKNNFSNLHSKLEALSEAQKNKFLEDFTGVDDDFLRVLNEGKAFEAWKKLSEITGATKTWISKSKAILERVNTKNLSDADIEKLKNYYSNHQMPSDRPSDPPFTHRGTPFDNFGHPNFVNDIPSIAGHGKIGYHPASIGQPVLTGKGTDMTKANTWGETTFGRNNFRKNGTTGRCLIYDPNSPYTINDPTSPNHGWVDCVWHHHEDAKTMIPVPFETHNRASPDGSSHTGGAAILTNSLSSLIGFFTSPSGIKISF